MQTAAMTSRFLTGCSSSVGLADSEIVVSHGGTIQHIVVSRFAQTVCSQQAVLKYTNVLIQFAEQAYMLRDVDALAEVSRVLMSLPMDGARQIGLYYQALVIKRRGQINEAERLLETVADNAPSEYRARAIQGLGAVHHDLGHLDEALRFQIEALRAASDRNGRGFQTTLWARWEISIIRGLDGDHKGALSDLKNLRPLVNLAAKQKPFYFYAYCNDLAVELGELGRITEAQAALDVALASPYAPAYPDWIETRDEIATKLVSARPSVVAVKRAPEAEPSPLIEPQREAQRWSSLFSRRLARRETFLQRASNTIVMTQAIFRGGNTLLILYFLRNCVRTRGPPALYRGTFRPFSKSIGESAEKKLGAEQDQFATQCFYAQFSRLIAVIGVCVSLYRRTSGTRSPPLRCERQSEAGLLNQVASASDVYCFKAYKYAHLRLGVLQPHEVTPHNQLLGFQMIWAGRHKCGSLPTLTAHARVKELTLNRHTLACRRIRMTIPRKKARKSMSESLEVSNLQPYVVPETSIRDLVQNLRVGEAQNAATWLLVIGEAIKAIVRGKTETGELNLRLIKQIAVEPECRPIRSIVEAITTAIEQGAEGTYAASLTITRFLEFAFEYAPDPRVAERLYKNELNTIKKRP